MKPKLRYCLQWLREGAAQVVRTHPVELLLVLFACVGCLLTYELEWEHALDKLALVPLFFALALTVNGLAGSSPWRRVYWVCWVPLVPLMCWPGLGAWVDSAPYAISVGILAPLALAASLRAVRNERFVFDGIIWLRSAVLALFFANVALGLFYAIFYSTTYIFGLEGGWIERVAVYAVTFAETFAVPMLFLMMADRWRGADCHGGRIVGILLNYIVTPALLIYAAIFYLYMARILLTWTLPEGGVAYLVFGFTLTALTVKALQYLLGKPTYDWFYDRFSLVSLPMLVFFWIGVVRRTNEYGLTEPRVYLVACGGLMTLCVLLFLSKRLGRYLWVCLAALVCFAALAYVPSLRPTRIALHSQVLRAERVARSLGRLDADRRLMLFPLSPGDTVYKKEYRQLYESLDYIWHQDSDAFGRFGVDFDEFAAMLPERMRHYVKYGWESSSYVKNSIDLEMPQSASFEIDAAYSRYYTNIPYWADDSWSLQNDTLRIRVGTAEPALVFSASELVRRQLECSGGFRPADQAVPTREQLLRLLDYRDDRCRILFDEMRLERRDSTVAMADVRINSVWLR